MHELSELPHYLEPGATYELGLDAPLDFSTNPPVIATIDTFPFGEETKWNNYAETGKWQGDKFALLDVRGLPRERGEKGDFITVAGRRMAADSAFVLAGVYFAKGGSPDGRTDYVALANGKGYKLGLNEFMRTKSPKGKEISNWRNRFITLEGAARDEFQLEISTDGRVLIQNLAPRKNGKPIGIRAAQAPRRLQGK